MAFLEFAEILWEAKKPKIVLTDNRSVKRFFYTKAIPSALLNACDYVLHYNVSLAHIAGTVNTAADFLPRLELKVTERIPLKTPEDIEKTPIEVATSSLDVADEEHFFHHTSKQKGRVSQTNLWTKKTIPAKCEAMGSK